MDPLLELGVESDDDGEWVSVFAEAHKTQQTSLIASSTATTMVAVPPNLVFRKVVPKDETVAFVGQAGWRKRLGKRKSADSSRERSKRHDLENRQRKKLLEERLGIELADVKTEHQTCVPTASSSSSPFSGNLKAFRAKRAKLCRREKGVSCSSVLKHVAQFKSPLSAALVFLLLSTLALLVVPPKLGLLSQQLHQQHGADSLSVMDGAGEWQKEPPHYVPGRDGSSNPGKGTSPTPYLDPVQHRGTGNISSEMQPLGDGKLNQQTGRFFSTGKCTEMFQYKAIAPRGGLVPALGHMIRGATPPGPSSSMKVSILPRKPAGRDSVFVVVVVDGVKYYTYSCSLPQQISP